MCFPEKADGFLFQKVASGIGSLLCLNYGVLFGITSSNIILYQSTDTPLKKIIDSEDASLLGSYLCLGGIIGSLVFGYVSEKLGPKSALLLCGLLQIGSWFCILFGYHIDHIHSSRIAGGLAAGGAFAVLPTYIKDISEENNLLFLKFIIDPSSNLGICIGFFLAAFTPYECLPVIGLCLSVIFTMFFPFMPESPYYYVRMGDITMMEKSLRWLRGVRKLDDRKNPEFIKEVANFLKQATKPMENNISPSKNLHLMIVSIILVMTSQFSGIFLIFNYAESIFHQLSFTTNLSQWTAILLASAQLTGSLFSTLFQKRFNRNSLFRNTALFSGIILITLAILLTFNGFFGFDVENLKWLVLSFLIVHVFITNVGFQPLTIVVISEMAPEKINGKVTNLSMALMWFLSLLTVKFYYHLCGTIGFKGLIWMFGGFCMFGFFATLWFIPETRHKTLNEINAIENCKN